MASNTGPALSTSRSICWSTSPSNVRKEEKLLVSLDHEAGEMHGTEVVLRFREIGHQRGQLSVSALALAGPLIGKSMGTVE